MSPETIFTNAVLVLPRDTISGTLTVRGGTRPLSGLQTLINMRAGASEKMKIIADGQREDGEDRYIAAYE